MIKKNRERVLHLFRRKSLEELVAEARSKGECPEEKALERAEEAAELDYQEGLGEIKVVTDEEE
jgi:hypothetical protein